MNALPHAAVAVGHAWNGGTTETVVEGHIELTTLALNLWSSRRARRRSTGTEVGGTSTPGAQTGEVPGGRQTPPVARPGRSSMIFPLR